MPKKYKAGEKLQYWAPCNINEQEDMTARKEQWLPLVSTGYIAKENNKNVDTDRRFSLRYYI